MIYIIYRTSEEFSQGHACGAINVPYMKKPGPSGFYFVLLIWLVFFSFLVVIDCEAAGMSKNPDFLEQVSSHFGKSDKIIVGCQSGGRSSKATTDLLDAVSSRQSLKLSMFSLLMIQFGIPKKLQGFTGVTDITGGYAAWTHRGLPTQNWWKDGLINLNIYTSVCVDCIVMLFYLSLLLPLW